MTTSASSAAVLSVVQHVTSNKQHKVGARLAELEQHVKEAKAILSDTSKEASGSVLESQVLSLLRILRKAFPGNLHPSVHINNGSACDSVAFNTRLDTIERMLWETKQSLGFSESAAQAWKDELLGYLRRAELRMAYTALFGRLADEWAELRFGELSSESAPKTSSSSTQSEMSDTDSEVAVGRKEMHEQRQIWESHVTIQRDTDTDRIVAFLDDLFGVKAKQHNGKDNDNDDALSDPRTAHLRDIRNTIHSTSKQGIPITTSIVKSAIDAVLSADQLTSEKRRAMQDIRNRPNIIREIVDILQIDVEFSALAKRSYSEVPTSMQMRKAINGKYRVYLDLELLDAILIQCVGQWISVNIKKALENSFRKEPEEDEDEHSALMAQIYVFSSPQNMPSVQRLRSTMYERVFSSTRLPESMGDDSPDYDDSSSEPQSGLSDLVNGRSNKYNLRTDILRICNAEMGVQKLVHGQFCILQSDFEWFGPSIPHSTLLAILKYFNFPNEIIQFVQSFLGMHMRFQDDGPNGQVLVRRTGIPISFQLTDGIAELLLFTLDLAVNQRTDGANLYRNHDDLWFWGQPKQCANAWDTIREFTSTMGLRLNKDKTAFTHAIDESNPRYMPADKNALSNLPMDGKMKWGLLCFDAKDWTWKANKSSVEEHMDELRFQLKSRTSVMAYVQAYNAYVKNFLPNNFCPVVTGLGDGHATRVLQSLRDAQSYLFGDAGDVAQHVRKMIKERFSKYDARFNDVPDCFLYGSADEGGLGLANPAPAFAKHVRIVRSGDVQRDDGEERLAPMEQVLSNVKQGLSAAYRSDKTTFANKMRTERGKNASSKQLRKNSHKKKTNGYSDDEESDDADGSTFMPFRDYVACSEEHSYSLYSMYIALLKEPSVNAEDSPLCNDKWASTVFGAQIEDMFGGSITEKQLLSLELYKTLAEEKVRWEG